MTNDGYSEDSAMRHGSSSAAPPVAPTSGTLCHHGPTVSRSSHALAVLSAETVRRRWTTALLSAKSICC
ncbi:hypothetical protein C6A49_21025 [Enterobacter hormaechei]|nr:hypothetical protein C6A49_21025 [Enterobacter hormaechei]